MTAFELIPQAAAEPAPPWSVSRWFNVASDRADFGLDALRGRVVVLHAFQMLCPGCVVHGIPQGQRMADAFDPSQVAVIGLHTVFEHHAVMNPDALEVFLHEFRVDFPVGVDASVTGHALPATMATYGMRGTPSLLLIDPDGRLRYHGFGRIPDLQAGRLVGQLLTEGASASRRASPNVAHAGECDDAGCRVG